VKLGYARVSSKHQADSEALDQQIARLRKAGAEQILFDIESGRKDGRKQFTQIFSLVKSGVVSEVIVTRLDRLGRNVTSIHRSIETLQKYGVRLNILDSPMGDMNSAFGWLTINHIAGLAEFESRLLSERVRHGTEYYRSNLKYFGKAPFGYLKDENSKLIPHPQQWAIAKEIIQKLRSHSLNSISRWLLEKHQIKMHPTTFRKLINNPAWRGHTFYDDRKKDKPTMREYNTHQPLLSELEYSELGKVLSLNTKKDPSKFNPHVLPGIFRCGLCDYCMSQTRGGDQYQCGNYKRFGKNACTNSKTISKKIVKSAIASELTKYAFRILEQFKSDRDNQSVENNEVIDLQHKLRTLESIAGNPAVDAAILDLKTQISNYDSQQKIRALNTENDLLAFNAFLQADFWTELSDTEFKFVALRLLDKVTFDGERAFSFSFRSSSSSLLP